MDKYLIKEYDSGFSINGERIKDKIFNQEMIDYKLISRDDLIDYLIDWISEARDNDKQLMKQDLKYLLRLKDGFIFSSILTNEYIAKSDNKRQFNTICKIILKLNKDVEE